MSATFTRSANTLLGTPSLRLGPLQPPKKKGALAPGVCSLPYGHYPSEAEHIRHHDLDLPATPPLPANSQRRALHLHGFVVMPDHIHALITPAIDQSTAKCVQFIKGGYSFAAREQSPGEIWHSGYHEHRIRGADDFNKQLH